MKAQIFTLVLAITFFFHSNLLAQWTTTFMPNSRTQIYGTASDTKLFMPGGQNNFNYLSTIAVYSIGDDIWSTMSLSQARAKIASVTNGDKLFCAGGMNFDLSQEFDLVEIYNTTTNEMIEIGQLSKPRVELSAASVNDKVLFAGGFDITFSGFNLVGLEAFSAVDIYDVSTNTWTEANLSEARGGMAHAVLDNKVYFAGGYQGDGIVSNRVDIYDASTDTWSIDSISIARAFYGGGIAFNDKIYFAGGLLEDSSVTDIIDVYDPSTGAWTTENLAMPRAGVLAGKTENNLLFAGGGGLNLTGWYYTSSSNIVDIYNKNDNSWDLLAMPNGRINHSVMSANNQVFIAGGSDYPTIFALQTVEVFTDMTTPIKNVGTTKIETMIFPNPVKDDLIIKTNDEFSSKALTVEIISTNGQLLSIDKVNNSNQINFSVKNLPKGFYTLRITGNQKSVLKKFVKH